MRVICKTTTLADFSDEWLLKRFKDRVHVPRENHNLVIGRMYTVYGIAFWHNVPWYYLCAYEHDVYPKPYALEFFDVVDERLSKYWRMSVHLDSVHQPQTSLVFEEWARDRVFYEHLVDGVFENEKIFMRYRQLMEQEYNEKLS